MNDYTYENTLFAKYLMYLHQNKDNHQKAQLLNKNMTIMALMIENFDLSQETNQETWVVIHYTLEVVLERYLIMAEKNDRDAIFAITGSLSMLSKIWIK